MTASLRLLAPGSAITSREEETKRTNFSVAKVYLSATFDAENRSRVAEARAVQAFE